MHKIPLRSAQPLARTNPGRYRMGLTLIELLVVVGIIAIVIGILIPTLARARAQAQSAKCLSNLRQIGVAAMLYANEHHGQFPPEASSLSHLIRFIDWSVTGTADARRVAVRDAMLKYTKNDARIFFCPSNNLPADSTVPRPYDESDFRADISSLTCGRMGYWWVANPWRPLPPASSQDLVAAMMYWHQDVDPPVFDSTRPCKPGVDYFRKWGDKNPSSVIICTDQSRQAAAGWFWMHGTAGTDAAKSWKNNLFADGHCEPRRGNEIKKRWSEANPAAW